MQIVKTNKYLIPLTPNPSLDFRRGELDAKFVWLENLYDQPNKNLL
jgi:hypothetical protein